MFFIESRYEIVNSFENLIAEDKVILLLSMSSIK